MARAKKNDDSEDVVVEEETSIEHESHEVVPQKINVHGHEIITNEVFETYEGGELVHVKFLGHDGCTYEGKCIENGKLI